MRVDPDKILAALGGPERVARMDSEAKAEALEEHLSQQLDNSVFIRLGAPSKSMTVAELDAAIDQPPPRGGIGPLFASGGPNPSGPRLASEPLNAPGLPTRPAD